MKIRLLLLLCSLLSAGAWGQSAGSHPVASAFLSPNPVEDRVSLSFEEPLTEPVTIVVRDLTGKVVLRLSPELPSNGYAAIPLDLEFLRKGIYICQLTCASGRVKTMKFQKI